MKHAQTYPFETLDDATREYLRQARDSGGHKMPGIIVRKSNYLPAVGLVVGAFLIALTLVFTIPPSFFDSPLHTAMLQTAGFLSGGWLILAALRVWAMRNSHSYLGNFVYADALRIWDASGAKVTVTDIDELDEANATQNFNEGKYQNTTIDLSLKFSKTSLTVHDEEGGRQLTAFLNCIAGIHNDENHYLREVPPAAQGAIAREIARTGLMPSHMEDRDVVVHEIPEPQQVSSPRSGVVS
jgi:hypothetical protein